MDDITSLSDNSFFGLDYREIWLLASNWSDALRLAYVFLPHLAVANAANVILEAMHVV